MQVAAVGLKCAMCKVNFELTALKGEEGNQIKI
jgi:hypothetical protein